MPISSLQSLKHLRVFKQQDFHGRQTDPTYVPTNISICKKRTTTLVHKLKQTPQLLNIYDNIIKDEEKTGFIERLIDDNITEKTHYLPHRPVKKDSVTTPIRIVYDCSCRGNANSASLNDYLIAEPHS